MEPPLAIEAKVLSTADEAFLTDFGAALARFRDMPLSQFEAEYGPRKQYRQETMPEFIRGDANLDGRVDLSDVIFALIHLFGQGPAPLTLDALDTDDGGDISIADPIYLLGYLFARGPGPRAPFPELGLDPTADTIEDPTNELDYDPLAADFLSDITAVFPFTDAQEAAFRAHGFVVMKDRRYTTFFSALNDVFRADLPVYLSVDMLLDALHQSFDKMLATIETEMLSQELDAMLLALEAGIDVLPAHAGGVAIDTELDDVAFWIGVGRSLLNGEQVPCKRGVDGRVAEFLGHVASQSMRDVTFFGWTQCEDFSQFTPRGHYTESVELTRYFQAMMWVQRIGMKFLQLKRHAAVAFLLTKDLLDTGAIEHWNVINRTVEIFVGASDSLNPPGMAGLIGQAGIQSVYDLYQAESFERFARLALATGAGMQRINSQVLWCDPYNVEGFTPIPPAFHLMGQRFIVDSYIFTNVVHDRVPWRFFPSPLDAMFVLGNRAALPLLEDELLTYAYHPQLAALDRLVSAYDSAFWSSSFYNVWLSALKTLNTDTTQMPFPSVMQTRTWDRRILHAQLASWAQLRHDTVLYAKPSYEGGACDYPDGWVDPYPAFYDTLGAYARKAMADFETLGILESERGQQIRAYFEDLQAVSLQLAGIARAELAGEELTAEQRRFVKSPLRFPEDEFILIGCVGGHYNGWYLRLLFGYHGMPTAFDPTVIDVHTSVNTGEVLHVGVAHPNLMLLSVKNECGIKAYVGPVMSYYEFKEPGLHRLTDEEWENRFWGEEPPRPAWAETFIR